MARKSITCCIIASLIAVATTASAGVTGKYKYAEKGFTGTMVISQDGKFFHFKFNTTDKSNNSACLFEATESAPRVRDDQPVAGTSDGGAMFKIAFKGNTAVVDMVDKGGECGMTGYFGGKYVKAGK